MQLPLAVPSCGALWGLASSPPTAAHLADEERQVNRKFDIVYHFHTVTDQLPTADEAAAVAQGRYLHVDIEPRPYSYAQISAGVADPSLIAQAQGLAQLKVPVYVTFAHEPDAASKYGIVGTPAQFVAAWRHVHDLFLVNGATNAVWVWVVVGWHDNWYKYQGLYPGNDVVDWVSWEAYSTTSCNTTRNKLTGSFATTAGPMYNWLNGGSGALAGIDPMKPQMISEYGAVYDNGNPGAQGAWYQGIPDALRTQFPQLKAVGKWDNPGGACQYQTGVSQLTIDGMTKAGADPYVNQLGSQPAPPSPTATPTDTTSPTATPTDTTSPTATPTSSLPAPATGCATTPSGMTELSGNVTLETDQTGWTGVYNKQSSIGRVQPAAGSYDGSWALKVAPTAGASGSAGVNNANPAWLPASPGTVLAATYIGSAMVQTSVSGEQVALTIREITPAGSAVGNHTTAVTSTDIGWHPITSSYVAKYSGDALRYTLYGSNFANSTQNFTADCLSLQTQGQ